MQENCCLIIIDKETGNPPDLDEIVKEDWARGLNPYDVEGFAVGEGGALYLLDECGNWVYAPPGRFAVSIPVEEENIYDRESWEGGEGWEPDYPDSFF